MAETKFSSLMWMVVFVSLFGIAILSFISGMFTDTNTQSNDTIILNNMDQNLTNALNSMTSIGGNMTSTLQNSQGITVSDLGLILLNGIYTIVLMPVKVVTEAFSSLTAVIGPLTQYVPAFYFNVIIGIVSLVIAIALISLLFRKDF